jgi:hypothetical protein
MAHTSKVFSIFTNRCLVPASNDGRFPSSGFPNYPRPQLSACHFSQLQLSTDLFDHLTASSRHGLHRKRHFHYCIFAGETTCPQLLPSYVYSTASRLHSRYLALGLRLPYDDWNGNAECDNRGSGKDCFSK